VRREAKAGLYSAILVYRYLDGAGYVDPGALGSRGRPPITTAQPYRFREFPTESFNLILEPIDPLKLVELAGRIELLA